MFDRVYDWLLDHLPCWETDPGAVPYDGRQRWIGKPDYVGLWAGWAYDHELYDGRLRYISLTLGIVRLEWVSEGYRPCRFHVLRPMWVYRLSSWWHYWWRYDRPGNGHEDIPF